VKPKRLRGEMTAQEGSKGMSKGCLVALIVLAVVILLVVIAIVTCYYKKDDVIRYGATTVVEKVKETMTAAPQEGVDTTVVNAVADKFIEQIKSEKKLDMQKIGALIQSLQSIPGDKKVDSDEARQFINALTDFYPDLKDLTNKITPVPVEDSTMIPKDSVSAE